ncbi:sigma-70 family RNA polymerase sigma factor [Nocardioides humi]|uniref:RNA polymerase sigma factor, sigma-70 family n=1 Tax=Nocardioides humi TaxID=449461 RepID=A0ABN2AS44_9ACTN|nr:sigma-70 family RNA polymerase sigma factor [Nocardioides humi]
MAERRVPADAPGARTGARPRPLAAVGGDLDLDRLWRQHVAGARRLAVALTGPDDAEELVAEAFARVLAQVRAGRGPTTNFRSYLHTTIRNAFRDRLRRTREEPASDQPWLLDEPVAPPGETPGDIDADRAARAFATLPSSWQRILWHLEVEGRKPGELGELLGLRPRAVSSLAHRAREGLRKAYLDQHLDATDGTVAGSAACAWTQARLSRYVRDQLGARAERRTADHLATCPACLGVHLHLERTNRKLAGWLLPVVVAGASPVSAGWYGGAASGGALAGTTTATGAATGAATAAAAVVAAAVVVTGVHVDRQGATPDVPPPGLSEIAAPPARDPRPMAPRPRSAPATGTLGAAEATGAPAAPPPDPATPPHPDHPDRADAPPPAAAVDCADMGTTLPAHLERALRCAVRAGASALPSLPSPAPLELTALPLEPDLTRLVPTGALPRDRAGRP